MKHICHSVLFIYIIFIDVSLSFKSRKQPVTSQEDALSWLNKYGYNPCSNSDAQCSLSFPSLVQDYQKRFRLKVTGKLDEATKEQMNRPRCGLPDKAVGPLNLAALSSKWSRSSLTYSVRGYPTQFTQAQTSNIIREAFQAWLDYIPLKIEPVCSTCTANFTIDFFREKHSDPYAFDGSGGTLAHAFFPEDGRVHFDKDEPWTESFNDDKINLYLVAVHEIGHALGLDHTYDADSIMFPSYQLVPKSNILPKPDRDAIQALYGKKTSTTTPTATTSTSRSRPLPTRSTSTTTSTTRKSITTTKSSVTISSGKIHPRCRLFIDAAFNYPDGTLHTLDTGIIWRYLPDENIWENRTSSYGKTYSRLPNQLTGGVYNSRNKEIIFFSDRDVFTYGIDSRNDITYRGDRALARNLRNSIVGAIFYNGQVHIITPKTIRLFQADNGNQAAKERDLSAEFPDFSGTVAKAFTYKQLHHFFTTHRRVYVWSERSNAWQTFDKPMETSWFACQSTGTGSSSFYPEQEQVQRTNHRNSYHQHHRSHNHHYRNHE